MISNEVMAVTLVLMIAFVISSMAACFHCVANGKSRKHTLPCIALSILLFITFAIGVSFGVADFYGGSGHQELNKSKLELIYRRNGNSTMDPQPSEGGGLKTLFLREFT